MIHPFIEKEIRNLKILRLLTIVFLLSIDLVTVSSLGYLAFQNYKNRAVSGSFWDFAGVPLLSIFMTLLLPILPLIWLIIRRFGKLFMQLEHLNDYYANLYQDYCHSIPRVFSGIPPYLFSQEGLIINGNLHQKILTKSDFDQIHILRIRHGIRGTVVLTFYQGEKRVARLAYNILDHPAVHFLLKHISLVHPTVTIRQ